jgi:hypothetical protein
MPHRTERPTPRQEPRRTTLTLLTLLLLAVAAGDAAAAVTSASPGTVRFVKRGDPSFDAYTNTLTSTTQQFMRDHFWRFKTFSPYFDSRLPLYPDTWFYFDSYAIYNPSAFADQHPDWILRDGAGNRLFIDYAYDGTTYPQYAADISQPAFRAWWIGEASRLVAKGYRGVWVDDVNLDWRIANQAGVATVPIDRTTGAPMTIEAWRGHFATFMEELRVALPNAEIVHNSLWAAGPEGIRDQDPAIRRQILACDWVNLEHGFNDSGLTGGTWIWSVSAKMAFIDRVHALGKGVIVDDFGNGPGQPEYALAAYFLTSNGRDAIGNQAMTPADWWAGYDVALGEPAATRTTWNGLMRRDFSGGLALLNEPGAPTRTVSLPGAYRRIDGATVTSITLAARQGAVLRSTTAAPAPSGTVYLSDLAWTSMSNGWGPVERDRSNGEAGTADGRTITLNGATHAKGLGAHAASDVLYAITGYRRFLASVGVDDECGPDGTIIFRVFADGVKLFDSGVMTATTATKSIDIDITGRSQLRLEITDGGDGIGSDHGDWASARIQAGDTTPPALSAIQAASIGATAATIQWTTSEPADTQVEYGTSISYGASTALDGALIASHARTLSGLASGTLYHYRVKSRDAAGNLAVSADLTFTTLAPLPTAVYLSDLAWTSMTNGWGPAEKDRSNGETGASDGRVITLGGRTYAKGLGVHAASELRYALGGAYATFIADVGVDDETGAYGSVVFQVYADGVKLFDSGVMTGTTATKPVSIGVGGRSVLRLVVTDAGNGNGSDHADWAGARLVRATAAVSAAPDAPSSSHARAESEAGGTGSRAAWAPASHAWRCSSP